MSADAEDLTPLDFMAARVHELRPVSNRVEPAHDKPLFSIQMLADMPDSEDAPDWIVDEIFERDTTVLLYGDPEAGKSFGALDLACCIATGRPWHGHDTKQGPVAYIAGEGKKGLLRRLKGWALAHDVDWRAIPLGFSTTSTALTDAGAAGELVATMLRFRDTHGAPALCVYDTLARNFGPGDENSTQDSTAAVDTLDRVREATGDATQLVVHHSGHGDKTRARGSIVFKASVETEYQFVREIDGLIRVTCTKMKDAEKPKPKTFRLEPVELGYQDSKGRPVTTAILRETTVTPAPGASDLPLPRKAGKGQHQRKALEALDALYRQQQETLRRQGYDPSNARVTADDWRVACLVNGIPRQRLHDLQTSLVAVGFVRIGDGYIVRNKAPHDQ